jgi:hypothetical protein
MLQPSPLITQEWWCLADFIGIQEAHAFLHWCRQFHGRLASRPDLEIRAPRLIHWHTWLVTRSRRKKSQLHQLIEL